MKSHEEPRSQSKYAETKYGAALWGSMDDCMFKWSTHGRKENPSTGTTVGPQHTPFPFLKPPQMLKPVDS